MRATALVNKIISTFGLLLSPALGVFLGLLSFSNKSRNRYNVLIISISIFFFMCYMPPMADLFRHYLKFSLYNGAGLDYFIDDAIDITLPVVMYVFRFLNIPFYFLAPLFVSFSAYLLLTSLGYALQKYCGNRCSSRTYVIINAIAICLMPVFIIASGLRFGFASFIVIYAIYGYLSNVFGIRKYLILVVIASLTHFSVFIFLLLPFSMGILTASRSKFFVFFVISAMASTLLMPIVISSIPALNTAYAQVYLFGRYSSIGGKNLNGMIAYSLQFLPTFVFFIYFMLNRVASSGALRKACSFVVLITTLSMFSTELFQRFNIVAMYVLFLHFVVTLCNKHVRKVKSLPLIAVLIMSVIYFSFQSVYVFRRQVALGNMSQALYVSPLYKIFTIDDDFNAVIKQIDKNTGEWIGNEAASE